VNHADYELRRVRAQRDELLDACYTALNLEGLALRAHVPALNGLDVPYHFDKIRAAIAFATGATNA